MQTNLMCILKKFFGLLSEADHEIRTGLRRLFAEETDARIIICLLDLYFT